MTKPELILLPKLDYYLLSGKLPTTSPNLKEHNLIFEFWASQWSDIYKSADSLSHFSEDDFLRQDWVSSIFCDGAPIAVMFHTHFNTASLAALRHKYFHFYNDTFLNYLKKNEIRSVLSFEYFLVSKDWSKKLPGFGVGELLVSLGMNFFSEQSESNTCVATVRTDVAAALQASRCGFKSVVSGLMKRNFPVDLMACQKSEIRPSTNATLNEFKMSLWNHRITDAAPFVTSSPKTDRKAS